MDKSVREITLDRLEVLEKQAAYFGPHTPPGVLVEIQDIYTKYPELRTKNTRLVFAQLDYEFLMNTVAAGLKRLTELENRYATDQGARRLRQLVLNIWLTVNTTLLIVLLLLVIFR